MKTASEALEVTAMVLTSDLGANSLATQNSHLRNGLIKINIKDISLKEKMKNIISCQVFDIPRQRILKQDDLKKMSREADI